MGPNAANVLTNRNSANAGKVALNIRDSRERSGNIEKPSQ